MAKKVKKMKDRLLEEKKAIVEGKVGPNISFSKSKADQVRKRLKNDIIQDTSAPPINLDVTAKDEENKITEAKLHPSDSITFYMRAKKDLLDHIKQIARERSYNEQKDITYQMLITDALEKVYPLPKEK